MTQTIMSGTHAHTELHSPWYNGAASLTSRWPTCHTRASNCREGKRRVRPCYSAWQSFTVKCWRQVTSTPFIIITSSSVVPFIITSSTLITGTTSIVIISAVFTASIIIITAAIIILTFTSGSVSTKLDRVSFDMRRSNPTPEMVSSQNVCFLNQRRCTEVKKRV